MKITKATCRYCYKKVYWGFLDGKSFTFEIDTDKKHTCKYDTDKEVKAK